MEYKICANDECKKLFTINNKKRGGQHFKIYCGNPKCIEVGRNKKRKNARNRNRYKQNGGKVDRNRKLIYKYGITYDDYMTLKREQNNECLICKINENELTKILNVDHCHKTGKVRGLLCSNCNRALGYFKDNINNLKGAIKYLMVK